jgi:hypothetical protein
MPTRHHERDAVEKRLAQISIELGFQNLTPGQRASLLREQAALKNAHWEMSALVPSQNGQHQFPAKA